MRAEEQIPIQPVENPILCSPYKEPDQHWLYDTKTGIPSKSPGRRPASYWFKTERTGGAQRDLFAEEERDDLPLVNALREDVRRWRESGWENASETTKKLLRHWWREDRGRRLFFCQVESVETIIYLQEVLALGKKPRWTPKLTLEDFNTLGQLLREVRHRAFHAPDRTREGQSAGDELALAGTRSGNSERGWRTHCATGAGKQRGIRTKPIGRPVG
jgi:type III restriction enzyme